MENLWVPRLLSGTGGYRGAQGNNRVYCVVLWDSVEYGRVLLGTAGTTGYWGVLGGSGVHLGVLGILRVLPGTMGTESTGE